MTTIKERVLQIAEYKEIKKESFFNSLGVSYANFKGIQKKSALSSDTIDIILSKYPDISPIWLISDKGDMFIEGHSTKIERVNSIPLVDAYAIGGFGGSDFSIQAHDVKANYVIPKFEHKKVDFMIEVNGSSMYPKYNSGDVVACRIIRESSIIQWNKVYVIATDENGILIKRLKKSNTKDCLLAVSDNESYDPFDIPKEEINSIAIVVGVIRLE